MTSGNVSARRRREAARTGRGPLNSNDPVLGRRVTVAGRGVSKCRGPRGPLNSCAAPGRVLGLCLVAVVPEMAKINNLVKNSWEI